LEEERDNNPMYQTCPYMQQYPYMMYPQQMQQPMGYSGMMGQQSTQQPMGYPGMMGQMQQPMTGQPNQSMGYTIGRDDEDLDIPTDEGYRYSRPYYPNYGYYPYQPYYPYYPYHHGYHHGYYHHHR
jgi:hypothetical protein